MNEELKPCPFCGCKDVFIDDTNCEVECMNCGAKSFDSETEDAIDAWNRQAEKIESLKPLKPCPFCGNEAKLDCFDNDEWIVLCSNLDGKCAIKPCTQFYETVAEAINIWNTRVEAQS